MSDLWLYTFYSFRTIPGKITGSPWWTDFILTLDIFLMKSFAWSTVSPITLWPPMRTLTQPCCTELYLTMFTVCLESGMCIVETVLYISKGKFWHESHFYPVGVYSSGEKILHVGFWLKKIIISLYRKAFACG